MPFEPNQKTREILSFSEGEVSLSLSFCKKNSDYEQLSFALVQETSRKELYTALFKFMKTRPRSQWECEIKLKELGFLKHEIKHGIDYFITHRWINDEVFAQFLIEGNQTYRPVGIYTIKQKLKEKRVSNEIIESALLEYKQEQSFIEDGLKLIKTQMYRFEKYSDFIKQEKIRAYLYRRGFTSEEIQEIIKKI